MNTLSELTVYNIKITTFVCVCILWIHWQALCGDLCTNHRQQKLLLS